MHIQLSQPKFNKVRRAVASTAEAMRGRHNNRIMHNTANVETLIRGL